MIPFILSLITSFVLAMVMIPEMIKIAKKYNILDVPDFRKVHSEKVPTFGGLAIFGGFIFSTLLFAYFFHLSNIKYLLAASLLVVGLGIKDDFIPLNAKGKLIGQFIAALIVMYLGDIRFLSLHGFLGIYELNTFSSYLISLFTIIVITNAFNLVDGINGLAGMIGILTFSFFGFWFYLDSNQTMTIVCLSLIGGIIGFLRYNYNAQIFMGDTGSLLLGFLAACMTILFVNENAILASSNPIKFSNPVAITSCLLVYPLFDTIRVFVLRIINKRSPFSADRNHIHHLFLELGFSHLQATFTIIFVNLSFVSLGFWANRLLSDNYLVPIIVLLAISLSYALKLRTYKMA